MYNYCNYNYNCSYQTINNNLNITGCTYIQNKLLLRKLFDLSLNRFTMFDYLIHN